MKVMCEDGPMAGLKDIPKDAIQDGIEARKCFHTDSGDVYYRCAHRTEEGVPIFRWDPPRMRTSGASF